MKKYPFVRQRGIRDCGPACTLMILKYYGGYVSLDKLSEVLCTSKSGTTAYHIINALRSFGFKCDGYKYDDISLIKFPCILHIETSSYNHYVVLWKVKGEYVIIGDPSRGTIKVSVDDIMSKWTGVSIYMVPYKKITDESVDIFRFLYKLVNVKSLIIIIIISFITIILSIILSFFSELLATFKSNISFIVFVFVFLTIFNSIFNYFRNTLLVIFGSKIDYNLSKDTFFSIMELPYNSHFDKTTGETLSYYNDLSLIKNVILKIVVSIFFDVPLIFIISIYFYKVNFLLFILNIIFIFLYLLLSYFFRGKLYYLSSEVLRRKAILNSFVAECFIGFQTIKNLNIKDVMTSKYIDKSKYYFDINNQYGRFKCLNVFLIDFISNLYILFLIMNSHGVTIFILSSLFVSSIHNLLEFDFEFGDVSNSINHIAYLNEKSNKESTSVHPKIVINDLSFSYDGVNKVLDGINLSIDSSEKVFVCGESGSGKSTLFKIIKGYYNNYNGKYYLGGYDGFLYNFKNILYVSSSETLFTGTILENLEITGNKYDKDIFELDDFIDDYSYILEENGANLSSGQRQRLSLARIREFDILIIDEGLSDVDINMERRILKKLFDRYSDKMIIFISHRSDNLDLFDRFIEISSGKIIKNVVRNV